MTPHPRIEAQTQIATPLGPLLAAATAQGLAGLWFDGQQHHPGELPAPEQADHPHLAAAARVLAGYFHGEAATLRADLWQQAVPLDLHGTPFQCAVWQALLAIPAGRTSTYGAIAAQAGNAAAVRAAGAAIGRNPVSILVPCHRVLGRDGSLTGYAGGLPRKQALLQLESGQQAMIAA